MFSAFQTFGKLGALASSVARAWSPLALWPDGIASPGMWISPSTLPASFNDYTGTTPVAVPGTVADTSNPVGLALDIRAGATTVSDPGNHMLQSTSAARPLESARVNLLTYTEDFSNAVWDKSAITPTATSVSCPLGNNATEFTFSSDGGSGLTRFGTQVAGTVSYYLKFGSWRWFEITTVSGAASRSWVDLQNGVLGATVSPNHIGLTATPVGDGWVRISFRLATSITELYLATPRSGNGSVFNAVGNTGAKFSTSPAQINPGPTALPYQRVGAASDYTATGFPIYQKYDGVDDGMATAAFSAGTLINGMDCMIAVRRDSAAATYLISDTGSRGFFEWASGDTSRPDVSAGTPTYYVDGVAVTATKGALFTALTAGDWHILEARGLDLSTWLKVEVSSLVSYRLNGPSGDIMLYPSTASTEDKDAARQYLADYYGVTLP